MVDTIVGAIALPPLRASRCDAGHSWRLQEGVTECPVCKAKRGTGVKDKHTTQLVRTDDEWRKIIAEFEELRKHGGRTGAFLSGMGVQSSTFYRHRKRLS